MQTIAVIIRYFGKDDSAKRFANEMISSGIMDEIRAKEGNLQYEYFFPEAEDGSVTLIDSWASQKALDGHQKSLTMGKIAALRQKYDLHMAIRKYREILNEGDGKHGRK